MSAIFQKLNYKDQPALYILNAPASFEEAAAEMRERAEIRKSIGKAKDVGFALAFATKQAEVDQFAGAIAKASAGDAVVWIAYPKGSSKKYRCEFNRDTGWAKMGELGFEPVRQVAIDEDWSALRFRRVEHIKKLTRQTALSAQGKARVQARSM